MSESSPAGDTLHGDTLNPSIRADEQSPLHYYLWQGHRVAYRDYPALSAATESPALVFIHPIGVGLAGAFWQPLLHHCQRHAPDLSYYCPDLLGCGNSDMPHRAYYPIDWAEQLSKLIVETVRQPTVLVVQGALLPVAVRLVTQTPAAQQIKGLVLSGPPAWSLMTQSTSTRQQRLSWNLLDSPLGWAFYRYARRRNFLASFSQRQLFAEGADISDAWLTMLTDGAANMASRHAVFSFLAGLWRQGYSEAMAKIQVPVLVVMGEQASTIDRVAKGARDQSRLQDYLTHLPQAKGVTVPGRNVLPYESTAAFAQVMLDYVRELPRQETGLG